MQASVFPLVRAYTPQLFQQIRPEVERVAKQLQGQLHSTLDVRAVTVDGESAWQYDLVHEDVFEQLTFVLRRKTEYQLYCRRATDGSNKPCAQLVATFRAH